jgi:tetratricopeptide (TPR) repeat protein
MNVSGRKTMMTRYGLRWGWVVGFLLALGCAKRPEPARCTAPEDNPAHHFVRAMDNLEAGKLDEARTKLDRGFYCDETYGPVYSGQALLAAMQASRQTDKVYKQADVQRAHAALEQAKRLSKSPEDRFIYHTTALRVLTALRGDKWLEEAEEHWRRSQDLKVDEAKILYYEGREAATYFMGLAYFRGAHNFGRARDLFRQVLDAKRDGRWHAKADAAWNKADKVARATAGLTIGDVGQTIALQEEVSRGDLAALLIDELKIDKLFAGRIPVKSEVDKQRAAFTPADVLEHPFKQEVLGLMKWQVRGLEAEFDQTTQAYLFRPKEAVTRKQLAIVLEDIVIKLSGDEKLASAYLGHTTSPFPDVRATAAWFNAIMTAVTRNLMETELSGEFRPEAPADGAEVLLSLRVLKQRLHIN